MNYQSFLNAIEDNTLNGFALCNGQELPDDLPSAENKYHGIGWEFRISIKPEKNNLKKAANAIAQLLHNANVDYKCLLINNDATANTHQEIWDGTQLNVQFQSDRDQRGKEICVYMTYGDEGCIKTPEEWKFLMIECWKALYAAEVEIGYISPPAGDKAIMSDIGVTPFSYTSFKPFSERHGILESTNYNPNEYEDPLNSVQFTVQDLQQHGLESHALNLQLSRLSYTKNHFIKATEALQNVLTQHQKENQASISHCLSHLIEHLNMNPIDEQTIKTLCRTVIEKYPRLENSSLELQGPIQQLEYMINKIETDQLSLKKTYLLKPIASLNRDYQSSAQLIVSDFLNHNEIQQFLKKNNIGKSELIELIDQHPVNMQLLYRRLVHWQHESLSLLNLIEQSYNLKKSLEDNLVKAQETRNRSHLFILIGIVTLIFIVTAPIGIGFLFIGLSLLSRTNAALKEGVNQINKIESLGNLQKMANDITQHTTSPIPAVENANTIKTPGSPKEFPAYRNNVGEESMADLLFEQGIFGSGNSSNKEQLLEEDDELKCNINKAY